MQAAKLSFGKGRSAPLGVASRWQQPDLPPFSKHIAPSLNAEEIIFAPGFYVVIDHALLLLPSIKLCNLEAAFFLAPSRKGPQEQFSIVVELSWHASRRSTVAFTWPLSVPRSLSLSP